MKYVNSIIWLLLAVIAYDLGNYIGVTIVLACFILSLVFRQLKRLALLFLIIGVLGSFGVLDLMMSSIKGII